MPELFINVYYAFLKNDLKIWVRGDYFHWANRYVNGTKRHCNNIFYDSDKFIFKWAADRK